MQGHQGSSCVCGHLYEAHQHYRAGTDCSACAATACARYRGADSVRVRAGRLLRGVSAYGRPAARLRLATPAAATPATALAGASTSLSLVRAVA